MPGEYSAHFAFLTKWALMSQI